MDSIYVERVIRAPIETVWRLTQDPSLHGRWDLRFSSIEYLPRAEGEPQRFLYQTRIGFGLKISGEGESVGEANKPDGTRTSALKFGSDEPISLIRKGSGYWQYEPTDAGTAFRTRYDYEVRHGVVGKAVDFVFRPLIGWATAWSFDCLALWAEREIPPEQSRSGSIVYLLARGSLAFVWLYHGLVPKLLFPASGEIDISVASGVPAAWVARVDTAAGVGECLFALALVAFWRVRWLLSIQVPLLSLLLLPLAIRQPSLLTRPFQPLTLNLLMIALAFSALAVSHDLPTARRCRRSPR